MTIATTIHNATQRLAAIGVDTAFLDARLLVAHALKLTREEMLSREGHVLTDHERASVEALIARREAREPVSQILGKRGFWRDEFLVTKDVLTPRPESETMIEALLTLRPERDRAFQLLDLGTGSGCLLLSALREYPKSHGTGVDESEAALNVARANAQALGLDTRAQFIQSDWCVALPENFRADIVLANPPYIPAGEIATLAPEVRQYDPMRALHGGEDGLQCYRKIFSQLSLYLSPHALILTEVGATQAQDVAEIGRASGMKLSSIVPDLAGFARIVVFQLP